MPQRSGQRPTSFREVHAAEIGVQVRTSSRQPASMVDSERAVEHDDAEEL